MPNPAILQTTLSIILALESSGGTNLAHPVITNPRSMHYGTAAIGRFAMMPITLAELGTTDDEAGAKKLATAILRRNGHGCPLRTAVILWERGPNHTVKPQSWQTERLNKAIEIWKGPIKRSKWAGRRFYGI